MFAALRAKVKGLKTLIGSGVIALGSVAMTLSGVDLSPLLGVFVEEHKVPAVACSIAVFFAIMRIFVTDTPVGQGAPGTMLKNVDAGE